MSESSELLVVDSSVAVRWFRQDREDHVVEARALLSGSDAGVLRLAAPVHIVLEVLNALRSRGADVETMSRAAFGLLSAHLELAPLEPLARRAAVIAAAHDLTVYDAAFVALAESLDVELVTADRRLAACPACRTRLLGDTET